MTVVTDLEEIALHLAPKFGDAGVIGIDGVDGVGKTRLAERLSKVLPATLVSLDQYLDKNRGCYVDAIRKQELEATLFGIQGKIIVEGVCLLAIAQKVNLSIDCLVYLKRTHNDMWCDEDICDFSGEIDAVIKREEDEMHIFEEWVASSKGKPPPDRADITLTGVKKELIEYHGRFKPHLRADYPVSIQHDYE